MSARIIDCASCSGSQDATVTSGLRMSANIVLAARNIELEAELASTRQELETLKADGVRWVDSMCRFAYGAGAQETAKRARFTGELPKWPGVES